MEKDTVYHGSSVRFKKFDLSHALEGDGKAKFGYGIYVTDVYKTAAHYAYNKKRPQNKDYYVYTIEVPKLTEDNHLFSCRKVDESIVKKTEKALGIVIPDEAKTAGKFFRKYVGNIKIGKNGTEKQMMNKADKEAEKAATAFFDSIGLDFFVWPRAQSNPDEEKNRVVLNAAKAKIVKIEKVELDRKFQLIEGSQKEIEL